MSQLHVAPENDSKDHLISLDEECWCKPQVQDEGKNQTVIHKPTFPMVSGSRVAISKVLLIDKDEEAVYLGTADRVVRSQPPFVAPPESALGHTHVP